MPKSPARHHAPAEELSGSPGPKDERIRLPDTHDLVDGDRAAGPWVRVGQAESRGPAPVAPLHELGFAVLDPPLEREPDLVLQPREAARDGNGCAGALHPTRLEIRSGTSRG
jgi:hypothetical protein